MKANHLLDQLRDLGDERNRQGMARYGINTARAVGVSMAALRPLAKQIGRDHFLAEDLWDSGLHEARILACLVEDPEVVSEAQLHAWAADIDSWDLCDQFCNKLVVKTAHAWTLAEAWALQPNEFVRRAGFSLMAQLAVHDPREKDEDFEVFLCLVERFCTDERNFVKKAVNWALRQIGKRNPALCGLALAYCDRLERRDSKAAKWIARDARRELEPRLESGDLKRPARRKAVPKD